jgi:hypothetical protein
MQQQRNRRTRVYNNDKVCSQCALRTDRLVTVMVWLFQIITLSSKRSSLMFSKWCWILYLEWQVEYVTISQVKDCLNFTTDSAESGVVVYTSTIGRECAKTACHTDNQHSECVSCTVSPESRKAWINVLNKSVMVVFNVTSYYLPQQANSEVIPCTT